MNSSSDITNWQRYFSKLGSRVVPRSKIEHWMDLEHFIVLGCRIAREDARLFTSFIILCNKTAPILSPFKIKKIAQILLLSEGEYKILGYVITNIQKNVRNKKQWSSLIKLCQKNANLSKEIKLFKTPTFKHDQTLREWSLLASKLELSEVEKYINLKKLYAFPIINMRFSGVRVVYSDINYYQKLNGNTGSINQMAKDIFQDYNSVYQACERILLAA